MCIIPFSPRMIWASAFFHPHFTDNDMKAQVGLVTFPRLSQDLNPGFSDSKVHVLSTFPVQGGSVVEREGLRLAWHGDKVLMPCHLPPWSTGHFSCPAPSPANIPIYLYMINVSSLALKLELPQADNLDVELVILGVYACFVCERWK